MSLVDELREQLRNAQKKVKKLIEEKKELEKKIKNGENLLEDFKYLRKKLNSAVSNLEENLQVRTENTPGNFGKYYREQITGGLKKGKIKELDAEAADILPSFRSKILDLDDAIKDLVRKISDENSLIDRIKKKLEEFGEFIDDIIPGGD